MFFFDFGIHTNYLLSYLRIKDGEEIISADIVFHSIIVPTKDFPLFLNQLDLNKDFIVPLLPDSDFDSVVGKIYSIVKIKPFLTAFGALKKMNLLRKVKNKDKKKPPMRA